MRLIARFNYKDMRFQVRIVAVNGAVRALIPIIKEFYIAAVVTGTPYRLTWALLPIALARFCRCDQRSHHDATATEPRPGAPSRPSG